MSRDLPRPLLRPLLLPLALMAPLGCGAQPEQATVLSVGDGDTIRVRQGEAILRVRLACIDAPELDQEPHGRQARQALAQRLPPGSRVRLEVKANDRYGRTVAEVFAAGDSGSNIGLALVEEGQAFAYRRHLDQCQGHAYLAAEDRASRRGGGVWQGPRGISRPWEFRRSRR